MFAFTLNFMTEITAIFTLYFLNFSIAVKAVAVMAVCLLCRQIHSSCVVYSSSVKLIFLFFLNICLIFSGWVQDDTRISS